MPDNQTVSHSQSLIRKIIFIFKLWFNLRLKNFLLKHKNFRATNKPQRVVSHQTAPVLAINGIIMEIPKMAKIDYRQMPAPRELSQQIPAPWTNARIQKPQGGGNFLCKSLGVHGGMVMDEIDTCITYNILPC